MPPVPSVVASSVPTDSRILELARLSPVEYERVRKVKAAQMLMRVATLDEEVKNARAELHDTSDAHAVKIPTLEPWPDPITDAPGLFDQISARFTYYVVMPPGAPDAITLWDGHAHAVNSFRLSPRLNLFSSERGCGKTTTLDVLATLVPLPFRAENMRAAVLFRVVDLRQPTLLMDEVDTWLPQADELRGLLNAGHKKGSCAYRCEGSGNTIRSFKAFAPAVLAGIGHLPPTLHDRAIFVPLTAAQAGAKIARFDGDHIEIETTLGRQLARWAKDNAEALAAANPPLPDTAFNRVADNWRPLFAVAHLVGGHWPQRALEAFNQLAPKTPLETDPAILLLADIRSVFQSTGADRLFSTDLVRHLRALPGRVSVAQPQAPLSEIGLARQLRPLGIAPHAIRIGTRRTKGYLLADFSAAFARHLPNPAP